MNPVIQRLRAEIASDMRAVRNHAAVLPGLALRAGAPAGDIALAAVHLHHAYCAFEGMMLRVARSIEGAEPSGPDWHATLLHDMTLDIPEVRPALFNAGMLDGMRRMLGFRHFFRHAYVIELDGVRLDELRGILIAMLPNVESDVARFDTFLAGLAG